ncbi:dicarboxylate/amino acid:cation symporter [Candidatus Aerophobetes bacterium]|uniref:Dicarboxylate/amino acid:cation symporter n=1 Tax=Aerophobetes bacterium TaxID=2030807 RepID=A0A2A4X276_UNCAE|nr:MAG: dicarboxylate/amino acid:cation symporter [Candidatus Aerophobetes bacterium]
MKPWVKIIIGLTLGVITGLVVGHEIDILERVGKAFIDLLKMLVGLIVFSSLVVGMCHISDPKKLGRIGFRTLIFYAVTTVAAISFGLVLVFLLKPGSGLNLPLPPSSGPNMGIGLMDFIFSIVPSNPFASFAEGNILQIIVFSIFFAFAITLAGEKAKPVLSFLESVSEVMYALTHTIMKLAPYGVFALIATAVGSIGLKVILPLLIFLLCNFIACFLQIVIVFCLSLKYLAKLKIAPFFKGMKDAIVLAFTTSSSSATLPVSLECARDHLGVSGDIAGFVMSLGSTINMNGAAIGQAVSAIFIAQAYGIEITFVKIIILIFVALVSAIGAAGIPGTGIVMLSVVLNAMGLPLEGIALVAGVDRIREMMSAVVNILGDAVATVYIAVKENQIDKKQYHAVTWLE